MFKADEAATTGKNNPTKYEGEWNGWSAEIYELDFIIHLPSDTGINFCRHKNLFEWRGGLWLCIKA